MVFPIEKREVHHPYSDQLSQIPLTVSCYSLYEVIAEKLRALIQRSYTAPRDFYDIWYLSEHVPNINWSEVIEAFYQKMEYKELIFKGIDQMLNKENDRRLKAAWENSLRHQIAGEKFASFDLVRGSLENLLTKIFN